MAWTKSVQAIDAGIARAHRFQSAALPRLVRQEFGVSFDRTYRQRRGKAYPECGDDRRQIVS